MLNRFDLRAVFDRLQGTAATALGLLVIALLFVYFVPRQSEIAAAMNARWERARIVTDDGTARPSVTGIDETDAPPPADANAGPVAPEEPVPQPPPQATASAEPAATAPAPSGAMKLLARPVALDTATILIRRGKVRLAGIQPVPLSQKCGEGANAWFCGVDARTRFRSWLLARSISCRVPDDFGEKAETVESSCTLGAEDIGRWLVRSGWAEAEKGGPYEGDEVFARRGKLGIWGEHRLGG